MSLTISRTIDVNQKLGRNDPCYCGSGKKYKRCHLLQKVTETPYTPEIKTRLLTQASHFLIKQQFFYELVNQTVLHMLGKESDRKGKDGKFEMEEDEITSIIDAVMFEGEYQGESPLAYFVKHAPLSSTEKQTYQDWLEKTRYSVFEVKEIVIGKSIRVVDLLTTESFVIYEQLATYDLQPGAAVTGRIVPFADAWMFTGGTNIKLTPEMLYSFKRTMHEMKPGDIRQLDVIKYFQLNIGSNKASPFSVPKKKEPGPQEKTLIQTMLQEGRQTILQTKEFDALSLKEKQKRIDTFTNLWLDTPQKELGGKTPKDIISQERKKRGLPPAQYHHTITAMPMPDQHTNECYHFSRFPHKNNSAKYFPCGSQRAIGYNLNGRKKET